VNPGINIDKAQNTPVYLQIVNAVVTCIQDSTLGLGSQLPSINQLAHDYGLARETVVKAFKVLQEKGIISPIHGKGYFVSSVDFSGIFKKSNMLALLLLKKLFITIYLKD